MPPSSASLCNLVAEPQGRAWHVSRHISIKFEINVKLKIFELLTLYINRIKQAVDFY
jgi:hypothetical protein